MSNFKVKLVKTDEQSQSNIRTKINEYMGIKKLQCYFPILTNYFDFF